MGVAIKKLSSPELVQQMEASMLAYHMLMGRGSRAEEYRTPQVHLMVSGAPDSIFNGVLRAAIPTEQADETIEKIIGRFRAYKVTGSWHVGPSSRPLDLGERLLARGFRHIGDRSGMAIAIPPASRRLLIPEGVTIRLASSLRDIDRWMSVFRQVSGLSLYQHAWYLGRYRKLEYPRYSVLQVLAELDEEPVGTAAVFLFGEVAVLSDITVLPSARRKGIGSALTRFTLREARMHQFQIGALRAPESAVPFFQQVGFQEYCTFNLYEWPLKKR